MIQAVDIEQMTTEERLQTMELLWSSLARAPESVPSPQWHGVIVAERLGKIERGEAEFLSLAAVRERLLKATP